LASGVTGKTFILQYFVDNMLHKWWIGELVDVLSLFLIINGTKITVFFFFVFINKIYYILLLNNWLF